MKIRVGHVSNSSSTSFLVYGARFDCSSTKSLIKVAAKLGLDISEYGKDEENIEMYELLSDVAEKLSLESYSGGGAYYRYIGITPSEIGDDETGGQFKAKIEKKIAEVFGEDVKCAYHEEAYYD